MFQTSLPLQCRTQENTAKAELSSNLIYFRKIYPYLFIFLAAHMK